MKKQVRIPKGELSVNDYGDCKNLYDILKHLKKLNFTEEDFKFVTITHDWSGCCYEGESPDLMVEWPNIY